MEKIRTFVAVDVAESVRASAARLIDLLRYDGSGVKWVEPQNLHLTLKFLGDVAEEDVAGVAQTVARAVAEQPPFSLTLMGAGAFPDVARPRTVWLGASQGREDLQRLQKAIESGLKKLGFPKEGRRFEPHLTLGRIRQGGPALRELWQRLRVQAAYDAGSSSITEVVVYASHLDRSGPTYQALRRSRLGA